MLFWTGKQMAMVSNIHLWVLQESKRGFQGCTKTSSTDL